MDYACGDCGPDYRVDSILSWEEKGKDLFLLNQDIRIVYNSPDLEKAIGKQLVRCSFCYDYYFEGKISYAELKGFYTLKVDSCTVKLRSKDCCPM